MADDAKNEASLKEIRDYFGMSGADMMKEWKQLSDKDKADLKSGLGAGLKGSMTY